MIPTIEQETALIEAVRAAAKTEILPRFRNLGAAGADAKTHADDLVTEADRRSELAIAAAAAGILPGAAIVGDPDQVVAKLRAYQDVGVRAFILSGYTHRAECELVAQHVLPRIEHAAIKPRFTSDL